MQRSTASNRSQRVLADCLDDPDSAAEAIVALDGVTPLDAVLAVDDQGTLAAARASKRLGLRGNPPDAVAAARDKLRMRTLLSAAEISQPAFAALSPTAEDAELTRLAALVGLPCVVKPTSLSASQGVIGQIPSPKLWLRSAVPDRSP